MLNTNVMNNNVQASLAAVIPFPMQEARPQPKTFRHTIDIFLKDSNATGNTYFARYFEWQGICRELWYFKCLPFDLVQSKGVFVTKFAHQEYVHETFPFQKVECLVNAYDIKPCSLNLLFRFFVDGNMVSRGYQKLVFVGHDKKIARLPQELVAGIREYEDPNLELPA